MSETASTIALPRPASPLQRMERLLRPLASLKVTAACLALLLAGVIGAYFAHAGAAWALALPLSLCAVNLGAAIVTNPLFRRQGALLCFHLALLAVVVLVAVGRLTYLKGTLELSQGEWFDGHLTEQDAGPFHRDRLSRVHFVNEGFDIAYDPGIKRGPTHNRVRWTDTDGTSGSGLIGDHHPLVLQGYRFYTSFNKGFALVFRWHPANGGAPVSGTVHLPAYPLHESKQALAWSPPGSGVSLWTMLQIDETVLDPARASTFHVPERHHVVVRMGADRHELRPGGQLPLPQGTLVYTGLSTWMGYAVFYDATIPWLLAAAALAVGSLALYLVRRYAARPWTAVEEDR
jgi:cytochrome c biogenesis protein